MLQLCFVLAHWIIIGVHNPCKYEAFRLLAAVLFMSQLFVTVFSTNYKGILKRGRLDEIFKVVSDSVKESYQGPYWRARLHMTLDPENAVEEAMEQYTEAFNRLEGKSADYDGIRIECLRYMMFYYLKKDDYDNCAVYVNKVLALDANDSLAKQIKAALSQLKK